MKCASPSLALLAFLSGIPVGFAAPNVCSEPPPYSLLSIGYSHNKSSSFGDFAGTTGREGNDIDLHFRMNNAWSIGAAHRYTILNARDIEPQTNGHLHTIFFPVHYSGVSGLRLSAAPALSASSNVVSKPDRYNGDALQLLAAAVWDKTLSKRSSLRFGLCADHRFGEFSIYPLVALDLKPNADWRISVGFPEIAVTYRANDKLGSSVLLSPDGNEWHVADKDLTGRSQLKYEGWYLRWQISWRIHQSLTLNARIGRQLENRYRLTLADDRRVRLRGESVLRLDAGLEWRFR